MLRFHLGARAVVALTVTALLIAACKGSTTGGGGGAAGGTSACIPGCGAGEECWINCTESYFVAYDGGCPDGCTPNMDSMPNSCFCDPPPPPPVCRPIPAGDMPCDGDCIEYCDG